MNRIKSQYDAIADKYDTLFIDESSLAENAEVGEMLLPLSGSVLDIGCGTGLLTEIVNVLPENYYGIDPSEKMLNKFKLKHPVYKHLMCAPFDGYVVDCNKYDNIVALFGSASYLEHRALQRLASCRNRKFLMFYKDDYHPVTYEKCGVEFVHNIYPKKVLSAVFSRDKIVEYKNYFIVR